MFLTPGSRVGGGAAGLKNLPWLIKNLRWSGAQQAQARANVYAAPFDALAYTGMQVNGSADVSQELGTTGTTLSSAGAQKYVADCFWSQYTGATGVLTSAQIASSAPSGTAVVGLPNAVNLKATTKMAVQGSQSDGDFACVAQTIEGYRIARLGFGASGSSSFAIGVWWYSTNAGTTFFRVSNVAGGTGRYYYQEVTLAAGWNYVTATIPGDTTGTWQQTTSAGLIIKFFGAGKNTTPVATSGGVAGWSATEKVATTNSTAMLSTTNNDQIAITGLIVVRGIELPAVSRAPFIMRPFDQELLACKRYFEKSYPYATAPGAATSSGCFGNLVPSNTITNTSDMGSTRFVIGKPASPTVTIYGIAGTAGTVSNQGGTDLAASSGVAVGVGENGFITRNSSGGSITTTGNEVLFQYKADARL